MGSHVLCSTTHSPPFLLHGNYRVARRCWLALIPSWLPYEVRMDDMASQVIIPGALANVQPSPSHEAAEGDRPRVAVLDDPDLLYRMEEQVHRRVAEHLKGALVVYLHITDDESGADDEALAKTMKKHMENSGKLRTVATTVINQVTWPNDLI